MTWTFWIALSAFGLLTVAFALTLCAAAKRGDEMDEEYSRQCQEALEAELLGTETGI